MPDMSSRPNGDLPRIVFWVLVSLTGAWLLWDAAFYRLITYSIWADFWEHSAALTEWLRNTSNPGNPHVADESSSARYIPPFYPLVLLGGPLGLDALDLMAISAVINYALVAAGIGLFASAYFRHPWAPTVTFIILFSGWGVPWIWSNLYELRSFFMTASYPSTFVFGLGLISFWLVIRLLQGAIHQPAGLLALLGLSAVGFISHALTGVFLIGAGCLLAVTESGAPLSRRALAIVALLGGLVLATFWPFFPLWDVLLASSTEVDDRTWQAFNGIEAMLERARSGAWFHMFFQPVPFLVSLGPALIGIPLAVWLLLRWRMLFIPLGLGMMTAPLVLNVFFQIALAHRFLLYAVFFMHLAMVWGILALFDRHTAESRQGQAATSTRLAVRVVQVAVVLAVIGHVALLVGDYGGVHLKYTLEVVDKRAALPANYDAPRLYTELTAEIPDNAVVIGNTRLTWPLPTFRGKAVALPENHDNALLTDQFERADAVAEFLAAGTPPDERRAITERYNVTHVLVNADRTEAEVMQWLQNSATLLTTVERYRIYALN